MKTNHKTVSWTYRGALCGIGMFAIVTLFRHAERYGPLAYLALFSFFMLQFYALTWAAKREQEERWKREAVIEQLEQAMKGRRVRV